MGLVWSLGLTGWDQSYGDSSSSYAWSCLSSLTGLSCEAPLLCIHAREEDQRDNKDTSAMVCDPDKASVL